MAPSDIGFVRLMTVDSPSGMFKQEFPFTINTFFRGRIMSQKKSLKNRAIGILSSVKCSLSTWGYKFASLTLDNTEQYWKTKEGSKLGIIVLITDRSLTRTSYLSIVLKSKGQCPIAYRMLQSCVL